MADLHARTNETGIGDKELLPVVLAAVAIAALLWLLPATVTVARRRELPRITAADAVVGTVRIVAEDHLSDPRQAYPSRAREQMPAGQRWWLAAALPFMLVGGAAAAGWRRMEPARSRARLGRRDYDPRGARPRPWARPRDLRELRVHRRGGRRFTVGRMDGRLVATDSEAMVALIAPPRAGKTTHMIIPWLLEHDGPALVTSTKPDVYDATVRWRARLGDVTVWDPFSPGSGRWTPLDGCESWAVALRRAQWLADVVDDSSSQVAVFWNQEAAKLLAPLLHAAALDAGVMDMVLEWLDSQDAVEPAALLDAHADPAAARQLAAVLSLDPRNRSTTYMSAAHLLAAYRHAQVLATARPGFSAERFLNGEANTLYLCASARNQRFLAPLIVAIVSSVLEAAVEQTRSTRAPLSPLLRVLLDETANCAPLRDLPAHLSQLAGHGVRVATVWQSLGQARDRYGDATDAILASSTAKVFMGPVTDDTTRGYINGLLGDELRDDEDHRSWRPKVSAEQLQQLGGDRALFVSGSLPPAVVRTTAYWRVRDLRGRARRVPA